MEPIVSPWIFYAIHICSCLHVLSIFVFGFTLFCFGLLYLRLIFDEVISEHAVYFKYLICVFVASVIMILFVPSESTATSMVVSSYITKDNIEYVQSNTIDFIERLMDAINKNKD